MSIKKSLDQLKNTDVYSLLMFALYKFQGIAEYSALSELVYILDKDNLMRLIRYFGGVTLTIPTAQELEQLTYSLLLYQYVNIEKLPYEEAIKKLGHSPIDLRIVKSNYLRLCDLLKNYEFKSRSSVDDKN